MAKGTKSLHHGLAVGNDGSVYFTNVADSEPADADLDNGEFLFWIDDSSGVKLKVKVKADDGTVLGGEVATLT